MSGGNFGDYDYYKVHQFADELEVEIHNNNKPDEYGYVRNYSPETIKYLRKQLRQMRYTADIMRHVDYLFSGDHGEDSFMVRVKDVERHHEENEKLVNQLDEYERRKSLDAIISLEENNCDYFKDYGECDT